MKKYLPYLLAILLIGALVALFATGNNKKEKQLDERITLRKQDKIPYGTYVAFKGLEYLFPAAGIYTNRYEPGYWDSLSYYKSDQALIIVTGKFNADESEMKKMISFIEEGNDVFVSARNISYSAENMMECEVKESDILTDVDDNIVMKDSLSVALTTPPFGKETNYVYPGKELDAYFTSMNEKTTEVLGENEQGKPNFIRLRAGKGNFYLHLAPLAFTNYFLLHKDNIRYYEKAFSVINPSATKIVWDEYYLNKKLIREESEKKEWFSVLMNTENDNGKKPFKAALFLAIFLLLLFVLLEMRRKQRMIPVVKQPRNDSMDFVRTIGRLYFDKGDHQNLCRKMSTYFLEHVRNKYKLLTGTMDEEFIKKLQYKSGADVQGIQDIVFFIQYLEDAPAINHKQLNKFHQQLESFYKIG